MPVSPDADEAVRRLDEAREGLRSYQSRTAIGVPATERGVPECNPYFGEQEVRMTHRVYESIPGRLAAVSAALVEYGFRPRQAGQAHVLLAFLHSPHSLPDLPDSDDPSYAARVEEAAQVLHAWHGMLALPPTPRATGGAR